jgi:ppGpp synthetase/RelA/SpoT-type nucleotidyltranferase
MDLAFYVSQGHKEYAAFADAVALLLDNAIRSSQTDIGRLQHIQKRAKAAESLERKLIAAARRDSDAIEDVVKDLAGCRLIFYTNADVTRFLQSRFLFEEFEVDWDKTKVHYPSPQAESASELFISYNYVVRLRVDLVAKAEYQRFKGMRCEVQVQTLLHHAWSEMAHDTIYKRPDLKGFGSEVMQDIDKRMKKIMREHLLPAGHEFQKVADDYYRLSRGKELFDRGALEAISQAKDNNERHDLLERFSGQVLPHYDDLPSVQSEIRAAVVGALKLARESPVVPRQTPFGNFAGVAAETIADQVADIVDRLRYMGEEAIIQTRDVLFDLYRGATTEQERKRLLESARRLATHDMNVWNVAGPIVQQIIVDGIATFDDRTFAANAVVALEMLKEVLGVEIEGTTSTHDAVTIHRGAVRESPALGGIRTRALETLFHNFKAAQTDTERRQIASVLSEATRTPYSHNYSNALLARVLSDSAAIIAFYTEAAAEMGLALLQSLEHEALFLYRRNQDMPADAAEDPAVAESRKRLTEAIIRFREVINSNASFTRFKILVGYESVFPPAWENDDFDISGADEYRKAQLDRLVSEVNESNAEEWLAFLERCASTESDDLATFPSFDSFLVQLGRAQPNIALSYVKRLGPKLKGFLPALLFGLEGSKRADELGAIISEWLGARAHTGEIIRFQLRAASVQPDLLEKAVIRAIEAGDSIAVVHGIRTVVARAKDTAEDLTERILMPALRYMNAKKDTRWLDAVWFVPSQESVFSALTAAQADVVLSGLISRRVINYHAEDILLPIAKKWAEKVADFFGQRLLIEREEITERYEAIPFKFHKLHAPLSAIPDYLLAKAQEWFTKQGGLFIYRGGRLLANVFSDLPPAFQERLIKLIRAKDLSAIRMTMAMLRNFEGQALIHPLCQEIVDALPEDDELHDSIAAAIDQTGVVSGEYGFANALKDRKLQLEGWLKDDRRRVRLFAEKHIKSLERQIAGETRTAEERYEQRKRAFEE